MIRSNNSVETVNAAANAIISAENRVQQVTVPSRRWGACFSGYWCFGSEKHTKRINHAVLVPEPTPARPEANVSENTNHRPPLSLPFIAPPSSPVSFLNSETPSSTQSPTAFAALSSLSANAYSPTGPSIFAIGPYAHELQLVSPPVFSTFTTEPSTANFTPPPESIQLTTPSSPEVPFARLLSSSFGSSSKKREAYEFQSYQFYPGSPIGHLISPSSVSGTSSPFPDPEFHSSHGVPPKILTAESLAECNLVPRCISLGHGSILDGQISAIVPEGAESPSSHRGSLELTTEEVKLGIDGENQLTKAETGEESPIDDTSFELPERLPTSGELMSGKEFGNLEEAKDGLPEKLPSSGELQASREFKFDNSDGALAEQSVASEWWVNEKVSVTDSAAPKNWAFFPMVQPGQR